MDNFDRIFNWSWRTIITLIVVVFIAIIGSWIVTGYFVVKAANQVDEHGLRGVAKDVWCGKDANCELPTLPEKNSEKK